MDRWFVVCSREALFCLFWKTLVITTHASTPEVSPNSEGCKTYGKTMTRPSAGESVGILAWRPRSSIRIRHKSRRPQSQLHRVSGGIEAMHAPAPKPPIFRLCCFMPEIYTFLPQSWNKHGISCKVITNKQTKQTRGHTDKGYLARWSPDEALN